MLVLSNIVNENNNCTVVASQLTFGQWISKRSREAFDSLLEGNHVKKRKYKCRVKPECIATSIHYLQAYLPVVAGKTRNVKIDGNVIKKLPVYSRGGKAMTRLFDDYKIIYPETAN